MRVVNLRREKYTYYIGRPSAFGNPYAISAYRDRDTVITMYEEYARNKPELLEIIRGLPGDAVLGCFCDPLPCHGHVIVKLWLEMHKCVREGGDSLYKTFPI